MALHLVTSRAFRMMGGMLLLSLPLMGMKSCTTTESAGCNSSSGCSIQAKATQVWGAMLAHMSTLASSYDASQASMDISGSTVSWPQQGNATVELVDTSTGSVQASHVFAWIRTGTTIKFASPGAVNTWAQQNSGSSDAVDVRLGAFYPGDQTGGTNTLSATSKYADEVEATATTTWHGPLCPNDVGLAAKARNISPNMRYCGGTL